MSKQSILRILEDVEGAGYHSADALLKLNPTGISLISPPGSRAGGGIFGAGPVPVPPLLPGMQHRGRRRQIPGNGAPGGPAKLDAVNGHFICDHGRYAFSYADHRRQAGLSGREVPWHEAIKVAADGLARISREHGPGAVACLGRSIRSSLRPRALETFCHTQVARPSSLGPALEHQGQATVGRFNGGLAVSWESWAGRAPWWWAPTRWGRGPMALVLGQAWRQGARVRSSTPAGLSALSSSKPWRYLPASSMPHWAPIAKGALS